MIAGRLRALDLFCCEGGAATGLARAGFDVTGVDITHQPRYPFRFVQGDVFELIESREIDLDDYDFVWASPPCQGRTAYKRRPDHVRPVDTDGAIERTRALLRASSTAHVIENVPGAPLRDAITLCGSMFAETIAVRRHRCFEASFRLPQMKCRHEIQQGDFPQATNRANRRKTAEIGVWRIPLDVQHKAMGGAFVDVARGAIRSDPAGVLRMDRQAISRATDAAMARRGRGG
jgi:DNA (cytosine-5)-methyltransferase 1